MITGYIYTDEMIKGLVAHGGWLLERWEIHLAEVILTTSEFKPRKLIPNLMM